MGARGGLQECKHQEFGDENMLVIPIIPSKSGSKKLIESCQTTKKTHGEKGNIWRAAITWLRQLLSKRQPTDFTQTKGVNMQYHTITGRKWNTDQGMAMLVAPELALPGGHPQGHRCHLRKTA